MIEVMSDKMQMQRCCVVCEGWGRKETGLEREKVWPSIGALQIMNLDPPQACSLELDTGCNRSP